LVLDVAAIYFLVKKKKMAFLYKKYFTFFSFPGALKREKMASSSFTKIEDRISLKPCFVGT
jgi:hypothetical protein